jgi:hypothetical protein
MSVCVRRDITHPTAKQTRVNVATDKLLNPATQLQKSAFARKVSFPEHPKIDKE